MQKSHILIVEDEDLTRFNLRHLFEAEGYQVYEATDGESMDQQLRDNAIDLIIMDINLPGKNGLLLARELTQNAEIGLIFLTGRDSDIDKIKPLIDNIVKEKNIKFKDFGQPLRIVLTGSKFAPSINDIIQCLGIEEVYKRISLYL